MTDPESNTFPALPTEETRKFRPENLLATTTVDVFQLSCAIRTERVPKPEGRQHIALTIL